jgi:hypothetical protein
MADHSSAGVWRDLTDKYMAAWLGTVRHKYVPSHGWHLPLKQRCTERWRQRPFYYSPQPAALLLLQARIADSRHS